MSSKNISQITTTNFIPPHPLKTAVLFLIFNRRDTTEQVFEAIRKAKPPMLYVAADGPRADKAGEAEKVEQVRRIATRVDWDCEVKTLFRDKNLGCKYAVSGAIDWFFENEEEGIILEDDCLPSQSFFWFCEELLERYRDDMRVGQISGFNSLDNYDINFDYIFSKYGPIWGWASWRRAWNVYDVNISSWPYIKKHKLYKNFVGTKKEENFRIKLFNNLYKNRIDTWDYQWVFSKLINSMLTILPSKNLIINIGFNDEATHTKIEPNYMIDLCKNDLIIKKHNNYIINDINYERLYRNKFIDNNDSFFKRGLVKLRRIVNEQKT